MMNGISWPQVKGLKMKIINNKYAYNRATNNNSKFTIEFQNKTDCDVIAEEINLLAADDHVSVWDFFQGKKAQKLLANSVEGLIVFLSCKQRNNVISGEFFSLDEKVDAKIFSDYILEAQNDAVVDIDGLMMEAI
ncbi:MAG TPA: hypothetical protein ENI84_01510 [Thiothrix sp.]|nr:hypothetical protein [Thiothrix sp.]